MSCRSCPTVRCSGSSRARRPRAAGSPPAAAATSWPALRRRVRHRSRRRSRWSRSAARTSSSPASAAVSACSCSRSRFRSAFTRCDVTTISAAFASNAAQCSVVEPVDLRDRLLRPRPGRVAGLEHRPGRGEPVPEDQPGADLPLHRPGSDLVSSAIVDANARPPIPSGSATFGPNRTVRSAIDASCAVSSVVDPARVRDAPDLRGLHRDVLQVRGRSRVGGAYRSSSSGSAGRPYSPRTAPPGAGPPATRSIADGPPRRGPGRARRRPTPAPPGQEAARSRPPTGRHRPGPSAHSSSRTHL